MNATELLFYVQSQMGMPSANTASSSNAKKPSFHDQLQQKKDSTENPTAQKPQENPDASGNHAPETDGTQSTELDPYRQQLLAAAAMTQSPIQFVDMTEAQPQVDMVAAQPVAVLTPAEQQAPMTPEGTLPQPQNTADVATQQTADMAASATLPETKMAQPQGDAFAQGAAAEQSATLETAVHATQAQDEPQDGDAQLGQPAQRKQEQTEVVGSAQKEAPVFHEVKAAPVKVGDAQTVDTQSSDMDAQLANHLKDALKNGDQRVEIQLTPENLGSVTVQLTRSADGTLHVALNATGEKATALLEKHATGLENLLASTNRSALVQVEVQHQQESGQSQNGHPFDREGQNGQQQQQQQNHRQPQDRQDFMQQLRLGLIPLDAEIS